MNTEMTCDSPEPNADLYELDEDELRDILCNLRESFDSLVLKVEGMEREIVSLNGKLGRRDAKISKLENK